MCMYPLEDALIVWGLADDAANSPGPQPCVSTQQVPSCLQIRLSLTRKLWLSTHQHQISPDTMNTAEVSQRHTSSLPTVVIIATGGTALGHASSPQQRTNYTSAFYGIEKLVEASDVRKIANIQVEAMQLFSKDSINITMGDLFKCSILVQSELAKPGVVGGVFVHGTCTAEELAFFLDITNKSDKPIVVMGAVLPFTSRSGDGPGKLFLSVVLACNGEARGRGTMIVSGEQIWPARFTEKTDPNRLDAFEAKNSGPIGRFVGVQPEFFYPASRPLGHRYIDIRQLDLPTEVPEVEILSSHQGVTSKMFKHAISLGYKGIVLAALSSGYWPDEALTEMDPGDAIVVVSGQTSSGYFASDGVSFGIPSGFLSARKSRILLTLCLLLKMNRAAIRDLFGHKGEEVSEERIVA
ncbi:putative L-asparaginase 3 [Ilyonectria robusta]